MVVLGSGMRPDRLRVVLTFLASSIRLRMEDVPYGSVWLCRMGSAKLSPPQTGSRPPSTPWLVEGCRPSPWSRSRRSWEPPRAASTGTSPTGRHWWQATLELWERRDTDRVITAIDETQDVATRLRNLLRLAFSSVRDGSVGGAGTVELALQASAAHPWSPRPCNRVTKRRLATSLGSTPSWGCRVPARATVACWPTPPSSATPSSHTRRPSCSQWPRLHRPRRPGHRGTPQRRRLSSRWRTAYKGKGERGKELQHRNLELVIVADVEAARCTLDHNEEASADPLLVMVESDLVVGAESLSVEVWQPLTSDFSNVRSRNECVPVADRIAGQSATRVAVRK